jgi:RNA polymerase sigma factor (sigma-70 family)
MTDDSSIGSNSDALEIAKEDERLVRAIVAGDRQSEQAFALRFMRPVKAMLMARLRNPDLAADLLQDVMIEAICAVRRGQLREATKVRAFIAAVARNLINRHFRGEARTAESLEFPDDLPDLSLNRGQLEDQERETLALRAISSLDAVDRSILQMTLVDGLKPGIIAERLRLNPEVVRQRKLRATRRVINFVQRQSQNDSAVHLITGRRR